MTAGGENPEAAWQFINFARGPEVHLMSAFNANAPTRGSVFLDPKVQEIWPCADVALCSPRRGTEVLIDAGEPAEVATAAAEELARILKNSGRCQ